MSRVPEASAEYPFRMTAKGTTAGVDDDFSQIGRAPASATKHPQRRPSRQNRLPIINRMYHELWNIELRHKAGPSDSGIRRQRSMFWRKSKSSCSDFAVSGAGAAARTAASCLGWKSSRTRIVRRCQSKKFLPERRRGDAMPASDRRRLFPGLLSLATSRTCIFQGGETDREFGGRLTKGVCGR